MRGGAADTVTGRCPGAAARAVLPLPGGNDADLLAACPAGQARSDEAMAGSAIVNKSSCIAGL